MLKIMKYTAKMQKRKKYMRLVSAGTGSKAFNKIKISHKKAIFAGFFGFSAQNVSKRIQTAAISTKSKIQHIKQNGSKHTEKS